MLPYNPEDKSALDLTVKTDTGIVLSSPIGIGPYLSCNARGIDGILEASGVNEATGHSTFLEVGPCSPDKASHSNSMLHFSVTKEREFKVNINRDHD